MLLKSFMVPSSGSGALGFQVCKYLSENGNLEGLEVRGCRDLQGWTESKLGISFRRSVKLVKRCHITDLT